MASRDHKFYYNDNKSYWAFVDALPKPWPKWVFDFISIHLCSDGFYQFCSPLCLVDPMTGKRPDWEWGDSKLKFTRKAEAVKAAKDIAKQHNIHVVFC